MKIKSSFMVATIMFFVFFVVCWFLLVVFDLFSFTCAFEKSNFSMLCFRPHF